MSEAAQSKSVIIPASRPSKRPKDFLYKIFNDLSFQHEMMDRFKAIGKLEENPSPKNQQLLSEMMVDLLIACDFNAGLLVPYYYPTFNEDGPMSLMDRPFQLPFFEMAVGGSTTIRAGRQVGKSSLLVARQRIYCDILRNFHSLYVTSHTQYLTSYANRFAAMDRSFRFPQAAGKLRQNLMFKEFYGNSTVRMIRLFESADDARSLSASEYMIDEAQHFDPDFESIVAQCLKGSKIPARYYAGTSLTSDTFLETKYQAGSRGQWHIKSPNGKDWINTSDEEIVIKCMKPDGLTCPYTGNILDVSIGEYVHEDNEAYDMGLRSYHAPQIIVPEYANDIIKWSEIYNDYRDYSLIKFLQEVMGIPKEEGSREITIQDLQRMCCIPESPATLQARAMKQYYRYVVSGVDWGGSDHNIINRAKTSWTVHVMLGVSVEGTIDILHMQDHSGMEYSAIGKRIADDHKRLGGNLLCSDAGVGAQYNTFLRESGYIRPEKHFVIRYTGPQCALFTKAKDGQGMFNEYLMNKTESISSLFSAIKLEPQPRIRCYDWKLAQKFLSHFLAVYRNIVDTETSSKFRWLRAGNKPDDTVHAINFAFAGVKILMNEPFIADRNLLNSIRQMLYGNQSPSHNPWSGESA